jgi:hypothetical protein
MFSPETRLHNCSDQKPWCLVQRWRIPLLRFSFGIAACFCALSPSKVNWRGSVQKIQLIERCTALLFRAPLLFFHVELSYSVGIVVALATDQRWLGTVRSCVGTWDHSAAQMDEADESVWGSCENWRVLLIRNFVVCSSAIHRIREPVQSQRTSWWQGKRAMRVVPAVRVGQPWAVAANQSRPQRGCVRFANRGSPRGPRAG